MNKSTTVRHATPTGYTEIETHLTRVTYCRVTTERELDRDGDLVAEHITLEGGPAC